MLSPEQRTRFARHRSLVEIGDVGQRSLLDAKLGARAADTRVEAVRRDYLIRAGVPGDSSAASVASDTRIDADVDTFAGADYLAEAAASCLGALAAVEEMKRILGVGSTTPFPPELRLLEHD